MKKIINIVLNVSLLISLTGLSPISYANASENNESFMISMNEQKPSVAVIDFDNFSNVKELDYMEKGIPRIFNANFSKNVNFKVIDRAAVDQGLNKFNYSKMTANLAKRIGDIINADYVVYGNIQRVGKEQPEILINALIVSTRTGEAIYSENVKINDDNSIVNILDRLSLMVSNDITTEAGSVIKPALPNEVIKEAEKPNVIINISDRIAFTAKDSKNIRNIFVGEGNSQSIKISEGNENNDSPTWSPDGRKIAYVNQKYGVTVYNLNTNKNTRLSDEPVFDDSPRWTYNGDKLVFTTKENKIYAIYSANEDGSGLKPLSPDKTDVKSFDISKYNMIIYSAKVDKLWQIFLMDINGNNITQLTYEGNNYSPSWSPDGTKITFISDRNSDYDKVYVMNSNSTNQVKITSGNNDEDSPIWSPDGETIAFISLDKKRGKVCIVNPDGTGQKLLTEDKSDNYDLTWLPDGKTLGFTFDGNVYTIKLSEGLKNMINIPMGDIEQPVWKK